MPCVHCSRKQRGCVCACVCFLFVFFTCLHWRCTRQTQRGKGGEENQQKTRKGPSACSQRCSQQHGSAEPQLLDYTNAYTRSFAHNFSLTSIAIGIPMDFDERLTKGWQPHRSGVCGGVWRRRWWGLSFAQLFPSPSPQGFPPPRPPSSSHEPLHARRHQKKRCRALFSASSSTQWLNMRKVGCDRNARRRSSNKRRQHQWFY